MKLLAALIFAISCFGQVAARPPQPPTAAIPGQATITSGSLVLQITGDAVPAVTLTFTLTLGGTQIANWTKPIAQSTGAANSISLDSQTVTWSISKSGAWNATAVVNGATATGSGSF